MPNLTYVNVGKVLLIASAIDYILPIYIYRVRYMAEVTYTHLLTFPNLKVSTAVINSLLNMFAAP